MTGRQWLNRLDIVFSNVSYFHCVCLVVAKRQHQSPLLRFSSCLTSLKLSSLLTRSRRGSPSLESKKQVLTKTPQVLWKGHSDLADEESPGAGHS